MQRINSIQRPHQNRRGIAILWLILWGSLFLTGFCVVLEFATLWQARIELKNSLDAAALAAVQNWGSSGSGDTEISRNVGVAYFAANPIVGTSFTLGTNYDAAANPITNPNQNLTCDGNFIFGAITTPTAPYTFDAGESASTAEGTVFMEIVKPTAGNAVNPRNIGIFFDDSNSNPNLCIRQVKFTIPVLGNSLSQQPYFDADTLPALSIAPVPSDSLNRFNTDPTVPPDPPNTNDFRGLDVDPAAVAPNNWYCDLTAPPFTLMGTNTNPNGDICIEMEDQVPFAATDNRFRTIIINFSDGAFTSTDDPNTTDFFRFGPSINQLNSPALQPPGSQNDGEAWNLAPVGVEVTFYNTSTMTTSTATTTFVDDGDPNNYRSIATLTFSGGIPAVRAQATVAVPTFCSSLFGVNFFNISARSTAFYDTSTGQAALIHIENYICP